MLASSNTAARRLLSAARGAVAAARRASARSSSWTTLSASSITCFDWRASSHPRKCFGQRTWFSDTKHSCDLPPTLSESGLRSSQSQNPCSISFHLHCTAHGICRIQLIRQSCFARRACDVRYDVELDIQNVRENLLISCFALLTDDRSGLIA